MTKKQMMIMVGLLVLSVVSVGAHLITSNFKAGEFANIPDPSKLPATPAAPIGPPLTLQGASEDDASMDEMDMEGMEEMEVDEAALDAQLYADDEFEEEEYEEEPADL